MPRNVAEAPPEISCAPGRPPKSALPFISLGTTPSAAAPPVFVTVRASVNGCPVLTCAGSAITATSCAGARSDASHAAGSVPESPYGPLSVRLWRPAVRPCGTTARISTSLTRSTCERGTPSSEAVYSSFTLIVPDDSDCTPRA